jgi:DNA modification methylase
MPLDFDVLKNCDCLAGMKELDCGVVDLAFADPPFNIGYEYDCYDDRLEGEKYLDWCHQWTAEVVRVLKPDGTFWLAIGDEYAAELKVMLQREHRLSCRSWVVWYYTFGVNCKYKFSRSHAHLFHMVKDPKRYTFNCESIRVPSARQLVYGDGRANPVGRLPDDTWILRPQDVPAGFQPDEDTWYFPRVCGTFKERTGWHGCQMPEQLLGRIIRACSREGELVLDPFAGSGTTLAVAKKLGRRFLGFELSKQYAEQIQCRLGRIHSGDSLDGAAEPLVSVPNTANGRRLDQTAPGDKPRRRRIVRKTSEQMKLL